MSSNVQAPEAVVRRERLKWFLPLPALSAATAIAIVSGGNLLRGLLLSGMLWILTLPLLTSLEAGMIALMLFEPLRGIFRRVQFLFVDFTTTDPIHLITPIITVLAFAILLWKRRERMFISRPLGVPVTILGIVFLIQVFNPFQGTIVVGLSGALFILLPMAWFFFGRYMAGGLMKTAMRIIVVMGLICSLHGIYQLLVGFPGFEQYWISHTDHYESIAVGKIQRALATFNSAEEWARYVQFGAVIAFGHLFTGRPHRVRVLWAAAFATLSVILLFTGQRTAIFGLILGVFTVILIGAPSLKAAFRRAFLIAAPAILLLVVIKPPSTEDMWGKSKDDRVGTILSHSARGTFQPTKEASLDARFTIWQRLLTRNIPERPLGSGLGAGTVAAARYAVPTDELYPIDSFIAVLVVGCSFPAAFLFLYILFRSQILSVRAFKRALPSSDEAVMRRIVAGIMPMLMLNSFFGLTFSIYSAAPIAWMMIGWICAESERDDKWLTSVAE